MKKIITFLIIISIAVFVINCPNKPEQHTLTIVIEPENGGTVTESAESGGGNGVYEHGTVVTLTADPNSGFNLDSWSGTDDDGSTSHTNTVTMYNDKTITVTFEEPGTTTYNLSINATNGTVICRVDGSIDNGPYEPGTVVDLEAVPDTGYEFGSWSGTDDDGSTSTNNTVTMYNNKTVTATFESADYTPEPEYYNLPEYFADDTVSDPPLSPWVVGFSNSTGGPGRGPTVLDHSTHGMSLMITESALGDIDGGDQWGSSASGYSYAQIEFKTPGPGTLTFKYRNCGWDASANSTIPNDTFEFWKDLDLANIDNPPAADWTSPSTDNYDGVYASIYLDTGDYKLTWRADKSGTGYDEDSAWIDDIEFDPDGWTPGGGDPNKQWLIMMYMGADCDLEEFLWDDVNEMEYGLHLLDSAVRDKIKVVVLWDGISGYSSIPPEGGRLYELGTDTSQDTTLSSNTIDHTSTGKWWSGDEVDTSDDSTITGFLNWASTNYPDYTNHMLMFSDHGGGPRSRGDIPTGRIITKGAVWDETTGSWDYLETKEIELGISNAGFTGSNKLSILGFDACLMAGVEEAYEHRTVADYFVASLESEQGDGWEFQHWIPQITDGMTGSQLGTLLVESYRDNFDTFNGNQTLSCTDLSEIEGLKTAIDDLAQAIIDEGASTYKSYFESSQSFSGTWADLYEIGDFADSLSSTAVSTEANAVLTAMGNAIVYSWADSQSGGYDGVGSVTQKGLSIMGDNSGYFTYGTYYFDFADSSWATLYNTWY